MSAQTETLQFTISGLPAGTKADLEQIGRNIGKTVEEYLRGLIEAELLSREKPECKELAIQVEVPDAVSEQSLRVAEAIARQTVVIALQQQGELTIREVAAALELAYEQYLQLLAEKDLGVSRFEQDPAVLQALRRNLSNYPTAHDCSN